MDDNPHYQAWLTPSSSDWILCAAITLLGAALRFHGYAIVPIQFWTRDEYAFAWSGMSLIEKHVPTAWSLLDSYGDVPFMHWAGTQWRLVTPWLDHPPLFSLIVGAAGLLSGANSYFDVTLASIRLPALIMGTGSIALLYCLTKRLYGTRVALIGSLIFATSPALVYLSRLAVSENLMVFLCLLMLLALLAYVQGAGRFYYYLAAVVAGLAPLAKVTGIFLVPLGCLLLVYHQKWREGIASLLIGLAFFSLYFFFGMSFDRELFISILREHSLRFDDILIFQDLLLYAQMPFFDAWFAFGFCAFFATLTFSREKFDAFISFPVIIYVLILLSSGAQSHFYPWYIVPLYPFLSVALGRFFYRFIDELDCVSACLIIVCLATWCLRYAGSSWWGDLGAAWAHHYKYPLIALMGAAVFPFLLHSIKPSHWMRSSATAVALSLIVLCITANGLIVYRFPVTLASDTTFRIFVRREPWSLRSDDLPIANYIEEHSHGGH